MKRPHHRTTEELYLLFNNKEFKDTLFSKIRKKPNGCWEWTGSRGNKLYGEVYLPGAWKIYGKKLRVTAHAAFYMLTYGCLMDDHEHCVGHSCNNPRCVNPEHLYITTYVGNLLDAHRDGLFHHGKTCGEKHYGARLKEKDVEIFLFCKYFLEMTDIEIAKRLGVNDYLIYQVVNRKSWKQVKQKSPSEVNLKEYPWLTSKKAS